MPPFIVILFDDKSSDIRVFGILYNNIFSE